MVLPVAFTWAGNGVHRATTTTACQVTPSLSGQTAIKYSCECAIPKPVAPAVEKFQRRKKWRSSK